MAKKNRPKAVRGTSPIGSAQYVSFHRARQYKGQGDFSYEGKLVIPAGPEADAFAEKFDEYLAEAKRRAGGKLAAAMKNGGTRLNEDGDLVVKFKKKSEWGDGSPRSVEYVDARKNPMKPIAIGNGSKIRVAYTVYFWNAQGGGVTLQPEGVQVIELQRPSAIDVTKAFDEVEGGFEAGNEAPPADGDETTSTTTEDDDEDDGDF